MGILQTTLDRFYERQGLNDRAAQAALDNLVTFNTLRRWRLDDENAQFGLALRVLERLGWDFSRARPEYDPVVEALALARKLEAGDAGFQDTDAGRERAEKLRELRAVIAKANGRKTPVGGALLLGSVNAGTSTVAVEDPVWIDVDGMFSGVAVWDVTEGDVALLRVLGSSMEPDFPDGSLIAVRRPRFRPPDGTPVVLETENGSATLKLLYVQVDSKGEVRTVTGVPLNSREHGVQFFNPEDVRVSWVVLGLAHGVRGGAISRPSKRPVREVESVNGTAELPKASVFRELPTAPGIPGEVRR